MPNSNVVVIGAGLGGLSAALELRRRGYEVTVLERHPETGGKARQRHEAGFRWDRGPSIVVMPWVYRELFAASGLDPEAYLPLVRLDPAFRVFLSDGRALNIPAAQSGLADAFAQIDPVDGANLGPFMAKLDQFAKLIGHAFCDRQYTNWGQVMFSPLALSASVISPQTQYSDFIKSYFRSPAIRELLYGFPTYSGFDPNHAPASLAIIPWTIIREGVWYPKQGGIAAIPRSVERACRDTGVEIRTNVEVEAIERDSTGRVIGVSTSAGSIATQLVVSNSDYVYTHKMIRGGPTLSAPIEKLRRGEAQPSESFFTIELGCDRVWEGQAHHVLVLTKGSANVYEEVYVWNDYPADPPIYVNTTSVTDSSDAPEGQSNPFVVIGAPPLMPGANGDSIFEAGYADQLLTKLDQTGLPGLSSAIVTRRVSAPSEWQDQFFGFRGSIYGLGTKHNILAGGFRPVNMLPEVPGLFFVGGGVQPGAGMPMAVQGGKIVAETLHWSLPAKARPKVK